MPKRSNLFQDVVAIVHRHMADDAVVEESAMLPHSLTGDLREVDVTISQNVAGHAVIVSIEATATRRRADVKWVEQLVSKHEHLPTNKLILVASGGFTSQARRYALAKGAVPLEVLDDLNTEQQVLGGLSTLWAKSYQLSPQTVTLIVSSPGGGTTEIASPPVDLDVVKADGSSLCTLQECVVGLLNASTDRVNNAMGMRDIAADSTGGFVYNVDAPTAKMNNGDDVRLGLRWQPADGTHEVHLIDRLHVEGPLTIVVREMVMSHLRMGDTSVTFGEAEMVGGPSVLVVTGSSTGPVATMRVREHGSAEPKDHLIVWAQAKDASDKAMPS